jgi:hypothetical protein
METATSSYHPWNKGLIVGQKRPLLPRQVWSIRVRLELSASVRDLALFNLAIDSKLRASDLVRLKVEDICSGTTAEPLVALSQAGFRLSKASMSVSVSCGHVPTTLRRLIPRGSIRLIQQLLARSWSSGATIREREPFQH